jgi:hypothetical protein
MLIPDWLQPTFTLLPAMLWLFFGVGLPITLALLPRTDRRDGVLIAVVSMAIGPGLLTTAMFLIGSIGQWTAGNVLAASGVIFAGGLGVALRFNRPTLGLVLPRGRFDTLTLILIALIAISVALRFWNTAYWPYANYDELWVYGYNAKIFTLTGSIPRTMGYYPQHLPLSLTYGQLLWGAENPHAARAVVPYFSLAGILMTYVLGAKLYGRRSGVLAAAVWTLYPHAAGWSQHADLETAITFFFSGTATFFILAWRDRSIRYALISGLFAGVALWTKPTAGALIESFALVAGVYGIGWIREHRALKINQWVKEIQFRVLFVTGLALLPMGGMWYVRNLLLGHTPIVLPPGYWQEVAQRSGAELGWVIVLLTVGIGVAILHGKRPQLLGIGYLLILIPTLISAFDSPLPHRLTALEWGSIVIGGVIIAREILRFPRLQPPSTHLIPLALIYAFIIPYFVTWFWSYSYHFRLSFAIVPLFIVQIAALSDYLLTRIILPHPRRVVLVGMIAFVSAVPAWNASSSGLGFALSGALPDDMAKWRESNPALTTLVETLMAKKAILNRPLRVIAPGELRLPYFFPMDDIRVETYPTRLSEIADVDYFVDSSVGQQLYLYNRKFEYNQILASLTRDTVLKRITTVDDREFRYSVYTHNLTQRFTAPDIGFIVKLPVGNFAELYGAELTRLDMSPGGRVFLTLYWKATQSAPQDYSTFIHLWDSATQKLIASWGGAPVSGAFSVWQGVPGSRFSVSYPTRLWEAGEYIKDEWVMDITEGTPPGVYELRVGLFDPISGTRLPIGEGDSFKLNNFMVR